MEKEGFATKRYFTMNKQMDDPKQKQEGSIKEKFSDTLDSLKKNEKIEDLFSYAKSNTRDTITYVLMILGILMIFFEPFYGGGLIGIIAGIYFSKEIMEPLRDLEAFIDDQGMVRSLILGGVLLGFFLIGGYPIFIGAAVAIGLKQVIAPEKSSTR